MRFAGLIYMPLFWCGTIGLILFVMWAFRMRKKALRKFASLEMLNEMHSAVDMKKVVLKAVILCTGVALVLFSLLRPQWGFHWEEVKRRGLDIVIAIDTSKSMLAEDVKPNRLERSKLAVRDLLKKLTGDRVGLIAFAGNAFLQCPLTVDYNGFLQSLDTLDTDIIPRGGTSLARAIQEAIRSFEGGMKKYKVLVFITDGESHEGNAEKLAEMAKQEGIKIFCIGIGTSSGELIPVYDENGNRSYLKDNQGNFVKTRLDEDILQKIALKTGGSYVRASGAEFGLDLIYEQKLSKMEKRDLKTKMNKQFEERYQWFLGIGLLLLLIECFISERKKDGGAHDVRKK